MIKKNVLNIFLPAIFLVLIFGLGPKPAAAGLGVACFGSPLKVRIGEPVVWTAIAAGGSGDYLFNWGGSEGLFGSLPTIHKTYQTAGVKFAGVSVYSSFGPLVYDSCEITVESPEPPAAVSAEPVFFGSAIPAEPAARGEVLGVRTAVNVNFSKIWIIFSLFLLALVAGIILALYVHKKIKAHRQRRQMLKTFEEDEKHREAAQIVEQEARRQGILISEDGLKEIVEQTESDAEKAVLAFRQIAAELEPPVCLVEGEQGCSIVDRLLVEKHFLARRHSLKS